MSTVYEDYKRANQVQQPKPKSGTKGISSTRVCEFSEKGVCTLSETRVFTCYGDWWESCGVRYRVKNGLPIGGETT